MNSRHVTGDEHEAWAPNLGYKATHPHPRLHFRPQSLLRMSISGIDTDLDHCDLEIGSIMSSPRSQLVTPTPFEDDELCPVRIEQPDSQGNLG